MTHLRLQALLILGVVIILTAASVVGYRYGWAAMLVADLPAYGYLYAILECRRWQRNRTLGGDR